MKRTIYLGALALAALTMTNCSNDESVYSAATETQKAIGFETYATRPNQGRGLVTDITALQTSSFGVLGYEYTDSWTSMLSPDFMYNQQITYNTVTSKWVYTPVKLWPEKKKVAFFAYAPYNGSGITLTKKAAGDPKFTYTLPVANPENMIDIVADQQRDKTYTNTSGTVSFTFGHILSRVGFGVKTPKVEKTKIVLKGMELTVADKSNLYSEATYNMADAAWEYNGGKQSTTGLALPGNLNTASVSMTGGYSQTGLLLTNEKADPFKTEEGVDNYWYLIPSKSGEDIDLSKFSVKFTYDLVTSVDGTTWDCPTEQQGLTKTITLDTSETASLALAAGQAYDFVFSIGPKVISFDVTAITAWGGPTDQDITVE